MKRKLMHKIKIYATPYIKYFGFWEGDEKQSKICYRMGMTPMLILKTNVHENIHAITSFLKPELIATEELMNKQDNKIYKLEKYIVKIFKDDFK